MLDWINIDKTSDIPVYRQISRQIMESLQNGELKAGDKLPPERDLAVRLDLARGTVKKAYQELENNQIIESSQGRGSFISGKQELVGTGRKERAVRLIENMLNGLEELNFNYREMDTFIHLMLMERESRMNDFHIAIVDCNPEALNIFQNQLGYISRVNIHRILLDEISTMEHPGQTLNQYDLIITTTTHFSELLNSAPEIKNKILQAALSPSQKTIIDLVSLSSKSAVGIISESRIFASIIKNRLKAFNVGTQKIKEQLYSRNDDFTDFLADRDAIVLPPGMNLEEGKTPQSVIQEFLNRGGQFLYFEYQVERGSLVYIEEEIYKRINGSAE